MFVYKYPLVYSFQNNVNFKMLTITLMLLLYIRKWIVEMVVWNTSRSQWNSLNFLPGLITPLVTAAKLRDTQCAGAEEKKVCGAYSNESYRRKSAQRWIKRFESDLVQFWQPVTNFSLYLYYNEQKQHSSKGFNFCTFCNSFRLMCLRPEQLRRVFKITNFLPSTI